MTELSGEAAKASCEAVRKKRQQALLALMFLAAGGREDLWHPGYGFGEAAKFDLLVVQHVCTSITCNLIVFLLLKFLFRVKIEVPNVMQIEYFMPFQSCCVLPSVSKLSPCTNFSYKNDCDLQENKCESEPCFKDVRANFFCASLLHTQIHMPFHAASTHAKY